MPAEPSETCARIAPTPSGLLHRGNAYNFLLTDHLVRQQEGSLRLRIDDLDAPRVRPAYLQDIFDTLHWLGIRWQHGPANPKEQQEIYSQQLRLYRYRQVLDALAATGQVFACTCSRKDIARHSHDGQYPGTCRFKKLPLDLPDAAWRLHTPPQSPIRFPDALLGDVQIDLYRENRDFIIRRRDGIPAYHIASLSDDVSGAINLIVRGVDLLSSTGAQLYLAQLLDWKSFRSAAFYHHPLLTDAGGHKLSKSAGSASLQAMRESGHTAAGLHTAFLQWLQETGVRL